MLEDLIVSRVRQKLLVIFYSDPPNMHHVRDLVRLAGEEINAVRRELANLETAGLLKKENRGNRVYYWLNNHYPLYKELIAIIAKESGLGEKIIKNRNRLGRITFAMLSGKYVRKMSTDKDEVDLLLVGDLVMPEVSLLVKTEEEKVGKEINYTVMTDEEYIFRKERRDPFLLEILTHSRVMVIGDEEDLLK